MTPGLAVETRGLTRLHGRKRALDGLDLALPRGGIHAVVGANGAGKSTLFRMLLGFHKADAGDCFVLGRRADALTPADRARIGFVNEEHTLPAWPASIPCSRSSATTTPTAGTRMPSMR
jgi:ABC-2 type transport system ATP-binding protein